MNRKSERRHFYLYNPDANHFAGVGFSMDDDATVTDVHSIDVQLLEVWNPTNLEAMHIANFNFCWQPAYSVPHTKKATGKRNTPAAM